MSSWSLLGTFSEEEEEGETVSLADTLDFLVGGGVGFVAVRRLLRVDGEDVVF
jgi:hypothetical protein